MHEQYQAPLPVNSPALPEPFYYLHNFRAVLAWIGERYADLLDDQERAFIAAFAELPEASQALLVRMVMRKGTLFREGKLAYAEIGDTRAAVQPLLALGWVDAQPTLELAQLFGLLKKDELSQLFRDHLGRANLRKDALLERLQPLFPEARRLAEWQADFAEPVYELRCMALCDRLRLMYFGNLWQDWSEFVLADLGIYRYESVEFSADSRGFRLRADVDAYLHLFDCRQRFDLGEPLEELLAGLPGEPYANPWLEGRRVKLLFQFAQHCESSGISTWPSGSIANPATPARACGRFAAWNAASASPKPMHWRGRPAVRRKATPNARAWPDCCRACKASSACRDRRGRRLRKSTAWTCAWRTRANPVASSGRSASTWKSPIARCTTSRTA